MKYLIGSIFYRTRAISCLLTWPVLWHVGTNDFPCPLKITLVMRGAGADHCDLILIPWKYSSFSPLRGSPPMVGILSCLRCSNSELCSWSPALPACSWGPGVPAMSWLRALAPDTVAPFPKKGQRQCVFQVHSKQPASAPTQGSARG